LLSVHDLIGGTSATLVIAFGRLRIRSAIEYPDSDHELPVADWRLTTVWNQVEAAMSFQAHHPLLMLCEEGLHGEGILQPDICARLNDPWAIQQLTFSHDCLSVGPPKALTRSVARWTSDLLKRSAAASSTAQ
jgi:hypothetical protein